MALVHLTDRRTWPFPEIAGTGTIRLGGKADLERAAQLCADRLQTGGVDERGVGHLRALRAYFEAARPHESVVQELRETDYGDVAFGMDSHRRLPKAPGAVKHAAFVGPAESPPGQLSPATVYELDFTWLGHQVFVYWATTLLGWEKVSSVETRARLGGWDGAALTLEAGYRKGKLLTSDCFHATNIWPSGRHTPLDPWLYVHFKYRYQVVLHLLARDCGAVSPADLLRRCGIDDETVISEMVNGVPFHLAETPAGTWVPLPPGLEDHMAVTPNGLESKSGYVDLVAQILAACGHTGAGRDWATGLLATWKTTSQRGAGTGYYSCEDALAAIDDRLLEVIAEAGTTANRVGMLNGIVGSGRPLSSAMQTLLDNGRLMMMRQVLQVLGGLGAVPGAINGDGVYFYHATLNPDALARALPAAFELTLEWHSGGPGCTKRVVRVAGGMAGPVVASDCRHRYEDDRQPERRKRRCVAADDVVLADRTVELAGGEVPLPELTFSSVYAVLADETGLGEDDKLPATLPFVRLCALVSAAFNVVVVQTVRKGSPVNEPHVCGLHGLDGFHLAREVTTGGVTVPTAGGMSIALQLLMVGGRLHESWAGPFESLIAGNRSHNAIRADFDMWSQQGRPIIGTAALKDAHLGPDFVMASTDLHHPYPSTSPAVDPAYRIYNVELRESGEPESRAWDGYVVGHMHRVFCDAPGMTRRMIREHEELLQMFYSDNGGYAHPCWGPLMVLALSAVRRTDVIGDYFIVEEVEDDCLAILKDSDGTLLRRPVSAEAIGMSGTQVVAPNLLVFYITGECTVNFAPAGWDELEPQLARLVDARYPKGGRTRLDWITAYMDEDQDPMYMMPRLDDEVVKLLNVFFGMIGHHLVLDMTDVLRLWTVNYGQPESGKGIPGDLLFKINPETSIVAPDKTAFAGMQLVRQPYGRPFCAVKMGDPDEPVQKTLNFRRLAHGDFTTNVKNSDFTTSRDANGDAIFVGSGIIDLNDPSLLAPTGSREGHASNADYEATLRRLHPNCYIRCDNLRQPVRYRPDPDHKRLQGVDVPRVALGVKNAFFKLRRECERNSTSLAHIYPEISDGGEEPHPKGYIYGKQRRLLADIRHRELRLASLETQLGEGLSWAAGSYVLLDRLYAEVMQGSEVKRLSKRKFVAVVEGVVANTLANPLVQIKRTVMEFCAAGGCTRHPYRHDCCATPVATETQTHLVVVNAAWSD